MDLSFVLFIPVFVMGTKIMMHDWTKLEMQLIEIFFSAGVKQSDEIRVLLGGRFFSTVLDQVDYLLTSDSIVSIFPGASLVPPFVV